MDGGHGAKGAPLFTLRTQVAPAFWAYSQDAFDSGTVRFADSIAFAFAAVPSRTMALNRFLGASEAPWSPGGGGLVDPAGMTTVEAFLTAKLALPAALPTVA